MEVKKVLTKKRIKIAEIKSDAGKLGEETVAVLPKNLEVMFAGKLCNMLIKSRVASENIMWSYVEKYLQVPKDLIDKMRKTANPIKKLEEYCTAQNVSWSVFENLLNLQHEFGESFTNFKDKVTKIVSKDVLYQKFDPIKGFTAYQMALLISMIKDISKFDTPSNLMVYSGLACIHGMPVTKANINKIREIYLAQGKEFAGFNTILGGRMYVITDCLLRSRGYFFDLYNKIRTRLHEKAINEKRVEDKDGKLYMIGKKNQSLIIYTHTGAKRRIARVLLHLIWTEWRKLEGLSIRIPYPIEYLGHKHEITLEEVVAFETSKNGQAKK